MASSASDGPGGGAGGGGRPPPAPPPAPAPPPLRLATPPSPAHHFVLRQHGGVPALAQLSTGGQGAVARIISLSPHQQQRPSVANQSIVSALKAGARPSGARLQLFPPAKRPGGAAVPPAAPDTFAAKLQRALNHRIVRSKLVKEKHAEHLLEAFFLANGGNILDLHAFAKRPKCQAYVAYLREHAIDPKEAGDDVPSATAASSLPGISHNDATTAAGNGSPTAAATPSPAETPRSTIVKVRATANVSGNSTPNQQEQMVEKARQEAHVVQRVADLQREGLWSEKRLPRVQEQSRPKAHWDFLLEEMVWLAADFAQERKWKKAAAKKCARMVQKHFQDKALAAQRAERAHEQHLRRVAALCAKEVRTFWSSVEKLVEYKQNTILEEKRKRALDQQLSFIVDQTEKYSQLLAEGMNKGAQQEGAKPPSRAQSDDEFDPDAQSDEDDEETIEQEERDSGAQQQDQSEEVAALQRESQMELDDLLEDDLLRDYLMNRDSIRLSEPEDSDDDKDKDNFKITRKDKQQQQLQQQEDEKSASEMDSDDDKDDEAATEEDTAEEEEPSDNRLQMLVDDTAESNKEKDESGLIDDAAAIAESIQPKGNTLSSTTVSTRVPFLLKLPLREYQHIGLDWLVTMYDRKLNGILADEMGLGKTIQTIALLAHLACEQANWGPHLIVVPTSVMLNWEMECKKWCPAFKILTYYGSQKERRLKRQGWTKPNTFHICITSYKLVIQDHQSFRRKKWKYLILDEAQNIKNFKSQRWQLLLNFQTERRLLLTGTPLQNNLMELWSLMHFLMPNVFQSHREFKEWFSNPVTGMIEGNSEYNENIIKRLHKVLRPFLLRRLKSEVEKQMPKKYEHVVMCRLSKRQRFLYDDYMSRAKTKETLVSGNLLSVINVLMQLRKVCNHPNLFEVRPTISPFQCEGIGVHIPSIVYSMFEYDPFKHVDLYSMNLVLVMLEMHLGAYQCYRARQSSRRLVVDVTGRRAAAGPPRPPPCRLSMRVRVRKDLEGRRAPPKERQPPPQNVKVKVQGVQLVSQQGLVKTIPVMNIQSGGGAQAQAAAITNAGSVLKQADKISASFAQLVQTSTGKHLLLTSNPNIAGNIPVATTTTPGGQKLTFLSKQPVSTGGNAGQTITKAFVKFQFTSVTTATTSTTATCSNSTVTLSKGDELRLKAVNADFIGQLYGKQNALDVRWGGDDKVEALPGEEDPRGERRRRLELMSRVNERRCAALPLYGRDFQDVVKIFDGSSGYLHCLNALFGRGAGGEALALALHTPERRIAQLADVFDRFIVYVPPVEAPEPDLRVWHPPPSGRAAAAERNRLMRRLFSGPATALHRIASAMVTQFPDPRLIQYDCGKLQTLDGLLRRLRAGAHRALIFTQMTKMLDVLEAFLNFHGHIYLRLDGTTKVDQRQVLMERFNGDKRIFVFILSTRSGGVGVNLTGADTVIFYDSDWNPTMDAQAQDRCHRIGQTRDVHIYRLVSERTIEENILKKANQKRLLGDLAIEGGNFTTAYFKSSTIQDLFEIDQSEGSAAQRMAGALGERAAAAVADQQDRGAVGALESALAACEDDQDVTAARTAKAEAVADLAEFDENVPLDEPEREPEISRAEQEINAVIEQLTPVERYAMRFIEQTEAAWGAEQLRAAELEIEERKREWEAERVRALKEEQERRQREMRDEEDEMLTYGRDDAVNQVGRAGRSAGHRRRRRARGERKRKGGGRKGGEPERNGAAAGGGTDREEDGPAGPEPEEAIPAKKQPEEVRINGEDCGGSEVEFVTANKLDANSPRTTRSRGTVAINLWTLDVSPILPGVRPVRPSGAVKNGENAEGVNSPKKRGKKRKAAREVSKGGKVKKSSIAEENDSTKIDDEQVVPNSEESVGSSVDTEESAEQSEDVLKEESTGIENLATEPNMADCENESEAKIEICDQSKSADVKVCKVILNDIIADGNYKIEEESEDTPLSEIKKHISEEKRTSLEPEEQTKGETVATTNCDGDERHGAETCRTEEKEPTISRQIETIENKDKESLSNDAPVTEEIENASMDRGKVAEIDEKTEKSKSNGLEVARKRGRPRKFPPSRSPEKGAARGRSGHRNTLDGWVRKTPRNDAGMDEI